MNRTPAHSLLCAPLARVLALQATFPEGGRPTLRFTSRDGVFPDWRSAPQAGSRWLLQPGLSVTEVLTELSRHAPCPEVRAGALHYADAACLLRELQPWVVLEVGRVARRIRITGPCSLQADCLDLPSLAHRKGAA